MSVNVIRVTGVVLISILLGACAPEFQEFKSYQDPVASKTKMQCVNKAKNRRSRCESHARDQYRQCMSEQTRSASLQLSAMEIAHMSEMNSYDRCKRRAQDALQKTLNSYYRCAEAAARNNQTTYAVCGEKPSESNSCGSAPKAPRLEDFIDKRACGSEVGACPEDYDRNYEACGGVINREQRCVAFCD